VGRRNGVDCSHLVAYSIKFPGEVLDRGFWIYVINIQTPTGQFVYVGRTGDSSSAHAGSPFSRIGQHLDFRPNAKGNALSRNLQREGVRPSACTMEMIAVGPIFPEAADFESHRPLRDQVAALEYGLASALRARRYNVLGKHTASCEPNSEKLSEILRLIEPRLPVAPG